MPRQSKKTFAGKLPVLFVEAGKFTVVPVQKGSAPIQLLDCPNNSVGKISKVKKMIFFIYTNLRNKIKLLGN